MIPTLRALSLAVCLVYPNRYPVAMAIGSRAGIPHFLTALMVANGANAGNLSPISAVGVIANSRMAAAGLPGHEGKVMLANLAASGLADSATREVLGVGSRVKRLVESGKRREAARGGSHTGVIGRSTPASAC